MANLQRGSVLLRMAIAALAIGLMVVLTRGWDPPRDFALREVPPRDLVARVDFRQLDERATAEARAQARRYAEAVYDNDPMPLRQLKATLLSEIAQLTAAESFDTVDQEMWARYQPVRAEGTPEPTEEQRRARFQRFRDALSSEDDEQAFAEAINQVFAPLEQRGILEDQPVEANSAQVLVRPAGTEGFEQVTSVRSVLIDNVRGELGLSLNQRLPDLEVAQHVAARLRPDLSPTLKRNAAATRQQQDARVEEVQPVFRTFEPGSTLATAGTPLGPAEVELLELGYQSMLSQRGWSQRLSRAFGSAWLFTALAAVCGVGLYRHDRRAITELTRYTALWGCVLVAIAGIVLGYGQGWHVELAPLLLLAMTLAIAYRHQSAFLVTSATLAASALGLGMSLSETLLLVAPAACCIVLLDAVRHRTTLLLVGLSAGAVAIFTTLSLGVLDSQPLWPTAQLSLVVALWCLVAGSLMTCLLPLVEKAFRVQTDLSLLELGDPTHPLLQELIRRAPGTYNHSITVASLAEAAADSIGGRGLLVRVGAYFHDIGKMLKPGYFIENQGQNPNQHDTLVPAMSTLVIIAHVKDGADLARQNKLPECIVDFILQHHGTTLVEYFYRQAKKQSDEGDEAEVDETSFRYPGPKPQSKEAGVLMLADAVESASRTLVAPTPSRIESLVEELTRKRLEDGQFDECGLTLKELRRVGDSLVKSLTAVYHGRVKYPEQETA